MIGYQTGTYLRSTSSVLIGAESFFGNNGGSGQAAFTALNNTALGYRAGYNATNTADNNILIGYQAADNLTTGNNNIIIGYDIDNITATTDNVLNIGNLIFGNNINGTGTVTSTGNIGIGTSSPSSKLTVAGSGFFGGNLVATGTLTISGTSTLATTTISNLTLAQALVATSGGTGITSITQNQLLIGGAGNTWVQIATSSLGLAAGFSNSAQLAALLSDETGTGLAVFGTSPTFTSSITSPVLYGGAGAGSSLILRSTAGVGTTDVVVIGLGNDGVIQGMKIDNANNSLSLGENAGAAFTLDTTANIAIGFEAGRYASTSVSDFNTYIGYGAGYNNTGQANTLFGQNAGRENRGSYTTIIGKEAGFNNTGSENNLFGLSVGYENRGSNNNFFGSNTGYNNTGNFNEFFGTEAGVNLQATSTVAIGAYALAGGAHTFGATNFQAVNNTAIGYGAGYLSATGASNNILIGYQAADNLTTGNNNIIIGYDINNVTDTADNVLNIGNLIFGTGINGTSTTLSAGNIGIGTTTPSAKLSVDGSFYTTGTSTLATTTVTNVNVARNVSIGTTSESAQLTTTGSVRFATFGAGTLQTDANGNLSVSSDERLKDVEGSYDAGLDEVLGLEPILYRWNKKSGLETASVYAGFSAQNVRDFLPAAVGEDSRGYLTLSDRGILAAVVNSIKEIWTKVTGIETDVTHLKAENAELKARLDALEAEQGSGGAGGNDSNDTHDTDTNNVPNPVPEPLVNPEPESNTDDNQATDSDNQTDTTTNTESESSVENISPVEIVE